MKNVQEIQEIFNDREYLLEERKKLHRRYYELQDEASATSNIADSASLIIEMNEIAKEANQIADEIDDLTNLFNAAI